MKRSLLLIPAFVLVFDYLFWDQSPGLNVPVFTILVIAVLLWLHPDARRRKVVWIFSVAALMASVSVAVKGGGWAMFANIISLLFLGTAVFFPVLQSVLMTLVQTIAGIAIIPATAIVRFYQSRKKSRTARVFFRAGIVALPIVVCSLFYSLYLWGSPHFLQANQGIIRRIDLLFAGMSPEHFWFVVWAILVAVYFLVKPFTDVAYENPAQVLIRERRKAYFTSMLGLKREFLSGVVLLVLLNVLIAVVNYFDVRTLWFSFEVPENFSLKEFVHDGIWVLTVCVMLSIAMTIWLFRRNQNFYRGNKWLKILAYTWLVQNAIMVVSVYLRDYYYISWHGLAYGRIFVLFFLVFIMIGLIGCAWKIHAKHTTLFFMRRNSWVAYALVIAAAFVNWDRVILNYNFTHKNSSQIDYGFYLGADRTLIPLIAAHKDEVNVQARAHEKNRDRWVWWTEPEFWYRMKENRDWDFRRIVFLEWQSWTWNNRQAIGELRAVNLE